MQAIQLVGIKSWSPSGKGNNVIVKSKGNLLTTDSVVAILRMESVGLKGILSASLGQLVKRRSRQILSRRFTLRQVTDSAAGRDGMNEIIGMSTWAQTDVGLVSHAMLRRWPLGYLVHGWLLLHIWDKLNQAIVLIWPEQYPQTDRDVSFCLNGSFTGRLSEHLQACEDLNGQDCRRRPFMSQSRGLIGRWHVSTLVSKRLYEHSSCFIDVDYHSRILVHSITQLD